MPSHKSCCCKEMRRVVRHLAVLAGALLLQGFAMLSQGGGYPPLA
ncbi:hypothetical protein [Lentzea sp. NBRC 102530]|nr:hypothetical protein [Lentzea sp. NBRC 102530]